MKTYDVTMQATVTVHVVAESESEAIVLAYDRLTTSVDSLQDDKVLETNEVKS